MSYRDQLMNELNRVVGRAPTRPQSRVVPGLGDITDRSAEAIYSQQKPGYDERLRAFLSNSGSGAGQAPALNAFARMDNVTGQVSFDEQAYSAALQGWMRTNPRYKDWNDQDLSAFVSDTANMNPAQKAAREMWDTARIGYDKAAQQAEQDRNRMLAELETFKAGYNEQWITGTLSREKAYWDARNQQTLARVTQQFAQQGRVASPYVMAEISRRLTLQAADALQVRRAELEMERSRHMETYLTQMQNVLGNTEREVMDPSVAMTAMQKAGSSTA